MAAKKPKHDERLEFTHFTSKTKFNGMLEYERALRISGEFEGEINGRNTLVIEPSAVVKAHITVKSLVVHGHVTGNVVASDHVHLKEGSTLIGNIRTPSLEIDEDVTFDGQCEMKQAPKPEPVSENSK